MFVGAGVTGGQGAAGKPSQQRGDALPRMESIQELRANVARISERSRQLPSDPTRPRVSRDVAALAEAARAEAQAARAARSSAQFGEGHTNAAVFLGQLGYNVEEQLRAVRSLDAARAYARPLRTGRAGGVEDSGAGAVTQMSVNAFLDARMQSNVASVVAELHAENVDRQREAAAVANTMLWEERKAQLGESAGLRSVIDATSVNASINASVAARGLSVLNATAGRTHHGAHERVKPPPALSTGARRAAKFAQEAYSTRDRQEWPRQFATLARELASQPTATERDRDLADLWAAQQRITAFSGGSAASSKGPDAPMLRCVAASRASLELRAMQDLYAEVHGVAAVPPARELRDLDAALVESLATQTTGTSSNGSWAATYRAMRCGRNDAASALCPDAEAAAVLKAIGDASPVTRPTLSITSEQEARLQALYRDVDTARDSYRALVLLVLLTGVVGGDEDATRAFVRASNDIARTPEDVLWGRLAMVRVVRANDPSPNSGRSAVPLQALEHVQREVIADQNLLLQSVECNPISLAVVLLHAGLFAATVRVLLDDAQTAADGVHLAVALDILELLNQPPHVEAPIDLAAALQRHVTMLTRLEHTEGSSFNPAVAAFAYFDATAHVPAFVELCASSPNVATALFGSATGRLGPLLNVKKVNPKVVDAAFRVASEAAHNGQNGAAVNVLLSVHKAAKAETSLLASGSVDDEGTEALRRASARAVDEALALFNPALCHRILKALTRVGNDLPSLGAVADSLNSAVADRAFSLRQDDVAAFTALRTLACATVAFLDGRTEDCLQHFFSLPFVPTTPDAAADAALRLDDAANEVKRVMPRAVVMAVEALRKASDEGGDAAMLHTAARTLVQWQRRWRFESPADVPQQLQRLIGEA